MNTEFDLSFSDDALISRALFYTSNSTITIFVEDENKKFEYEEIFEKLFSDCQINIDCIFPSGGKAKLEEAYYFFGNSKEYGKTFFIADGDFDEALGKTMINADNFIYLKRYNIESYLLDEDVIVKNMRPKLKQTLKQAKTTINYSGWINTLSPFFNKLFALHFTVQKYSLGIENVGRRPAKFLNSQGFPNWDTYNNYVKEVKFYIPSLEYKISESLRQLNTVYGTEISSFVCGKYYINALKLFLNTKIKKGLNEDEIKAFLISGLDISNLSYVKTKLIAYINK